MREEGDAASPPALLPSESAELWIKVHGTKREVSPEHTPLMANAKVYLLSQHSTGVRSNATNCKSYFLPTRCEKAVPRFLLLTIETILTEDE